MLSLKIPSKEAQALLLTFQFYTQKQRGSNKRKECHHSSKPQNVPTVTKFEGLRQAGLNSKRARRSHSFFLLRHEGSSCSHKPTTRPHAFPGTACPGPCDNSMPSSQAPNPSRRERDLVTKPMQPDDVQRIVAHSVLSRNT